MQSGFAESNPARNIKLEKAPKKLPQILSGEEIDLLLSQPDPTEPKGCRDKAMLELLYATGYVLQSWWLLTSTTSICERECCAAEMANQSG